MHLKGKIVHSLVAAGLALTLTTGSAFAAIGTGTVTASSLRLRSKANTTSSTLGYAPKGASITVLENAGSGWYKVAYQNLQGYMSGAWLDIKTGSTPSTSVQQTKGTVTQGPLNVRSGAGTGYSRIGTLKAGAAVTILDSSISGWYKVSSGSLTGYVSTQYISLGSSAPSVPVQNNTPAKQGTVTTSALNVRSGAGTGYSRIGTLKAGATVTILDSSISGWYKVSSGSLTGYVSAQYVAIGNSTSSSGLGAQAAAIAASLVGKRYVSGAAGPNSFDCSGLTYYIYRQLGRSIARGSSSQYNQSGYFVPINAMQPGDLVYFFDPRFDSSGGRLPTTHVGIFMGNNQFIHASTTSYRVQYDRLFGGYYERYIVGAKRIG